MKTFPWISVLSFLEFAVIFYGLVYVVMKNTMRDYDELAEAYPTPLNRSYKGDWISISPTFSGRGGIQFGATQDGFFMKVFWLLRFGRKTVYVPWNEITIEQKKALKFFDAFVFSFRNLDSVKMTWYSYDWKHATTLFAKVWPRQWLFDDI